MQIARVVIGGILLFLGRELNFLFAAAMASTHWLSTYTPPATSVACVVLIMYLLGLLALVPQSFRSSMSVLVISSPVFSQGGTSSLNIMRPAFSRCLFCHFSLVEQLVPSFIGIFTEWALMIVSCLIGAYYVRICSYYLPPLKSW